MRYLYFRNWTILLFLLKKFITLFFVLFRCVETALSALNCSKTSLVLANVSQFGAAWCCSNAAKKNKPQLCVCLHMINYLNFIRTEKENKEYVFTEKVEKIDSILWFKQNTCILRKSMFGHLIFETRKNFLSGKFILSSSNFPRKISSCWCYFLADFCWFRNEV